MLGLTPSTALANSGMRANWVGTTHLLNPADAYPLVLNGRHRKPLQQFIHSLPTYLRVVGADGVLDLTLVHPQVLLAEGTGRAVLSRHEPILGKPHRLLKQEPYVQPREHLVIPPMDVAHNTHLTEVAPAMADPRHHEPATVNYLAFLVTPMLRVGQVKHPTGFNVHTKHLPHTRIYWQQLTAAEGEKLPPCWCNHKHGVNTHSRARLVHMANEAYHGWLCHWDYPPAVDVAASCACSISGRVASTAGQSLAPMLRLTPS